MVVGWRDIVGWVEMNVVEWICNCLQGFYVVVGFCWEEFKFFQVILYIQYQFRYCVDFWDQWDGVVFGCCFQQGFGKIWVDSELCVGFCYCF